MICWQENVDGYFHAFDENTQRTLEEALKRGEDEVEVDEDRVMNMRSGWIHLKRDGTRTREARRDVLVAAAPAAQASSSSVTSPVAAQASSSSAGTTRPPGNSFVSGTSLSAAPFRLPDAAAAAVRSHLHARLLGHGTVAAGEAIVVLRGAGVGNAALQEAITLAGNTLPAAGAHIPGRGDVPLGRQRGVVQFPYGELCTLLHAETREVLNAAAAQLEASSQVLAAELRYLSEQRYLSETGALLYDQTAAKALHLDDILACNHYSMDARHILWNLGNDASFQILTEAREKGPRRPATDHKERDFHREKERTREVVLRHGDAILLNIERVAHGVKIKESCAAEAAGLLPHRRMCVSIRPVVTASSPNADDYV